MNDLFERQETPVLPPGVHSLARVATPNASRYLQQFCKHFAHKRPVSFDADRGVIEFSIGECRLEADEGELRMMLAASGGAEMAQLMGVAHRHLVRFAFREDLTIRWQPA